MDPWVKKSCLNNKIAENGTMGTITYFLSKKVKTIKKKKVLILTLSEWSGISTWASQIEKDSKNFQYSLFC